MLTSAQEKDWGRVSASLESLNHFYVDDEANSFDLTNSDFDYLNGRRYATNNYLKVDYYKGRLSAGLQREGYFPTTIGYPLPESMLSLSNLYVAWTDNDYSVTAGTFYEQLGSGLLFRSWEDRALGLNNAILGARATYNYNDIFSVRVFGGLPRVGKMNEFEYSRYEKLPVFGLGLNQTGLAAADVDFSLSQCLGWDRTILSVQGSVLYKYEALEDLMLIRDFKAHNIGYSARVNFDRDGFYAKGEYVSLGMQESMEGEAKLGNGQLVELGYNHRGLGLSLTGRRLYCMQQRVLLGTSSTLPDEVNIMSYTPALCSQHTYMLANLNPYTPDCFGEIGGQFDAFYNFRRGSKIGGKRGMRVHANLATYFSLDTKGGFDNSKMKFLDFSVDVEKQWTKKFKSTLMYSLQDYHKAQDGLNIGMSHTVVADLLYKWTSSISTRLELQYLATKEYQKDWMAALLEVSFAPSWSIFASDMYNHGSTKMHYYNAGVSYSYKWIRVAAGYGRYRAGFICSGGVCRPIPAYTGANLTLTASF